MLIIKKDNKKNILLILAILIIIVSLSSKGSANHIGKIIQGIENKRILNTVKGYDVLETERFIIRYKEDEQVANLTYRILDKYYEQVCRMFDYYPKDKIDIVIYNDGDKLLKNTRLKKDSPPLGVYYGGVINILSPRVWISSNANFQEIYEKNGPVIHEFTHLIVDSKTNGNYPRWLTEGIALYTEYETTGFEWGRNVTGHEEISIEELSNGFKDLNPNLSYRRSFEIVKNTSDTWGFDKLNRLLDMLGEGKNIKKSTKNILKINLESTEKNF